MSSAAIDTTFGQASMDAVDALDPLFANMESDVADRVSGALYAGLLNGTNPNDLAGQLVDCLSPSRATTIARTEMLGAYRTSALDAYRANSDVVGQWMWSSARGGACIACLEMDGEVFSLDEEMDGMTHPNCFPAGVLVSGPRALGSTTRWYEGEIVEIETACGYVLTVTPNHPILTTRGWVAAGLLHKGGNVISRIWSDGRGATNIARPQDYQVDAPIEQVAVTLGGTGPMPPISVPTAPEDFHGDGLGSQVHVVRAKSLLRHHLYAALAQPRLKKQLRWRDTEPARLAGLRALLTAFDRVAPSAAGNVGRFSVAAAFVGSPLLRHQSVSLSVPAHGNAPLAEAARDDRPRYPIPSSKSLQRFARFVSPDRIVRVERRPFAGHVYNLQTREGWYIANNIIAHNCRCSPIPITSSWADILGPLGIDASDIEDTSILDDYETGAEWFAQQDAATQIDALGSKAAYEAVQAGEVAPRDFVGVQHDEQYGDTIYTKSLKEALTPTFNPSAVEQYQQGLTELDQLLTDLRAGATETETEGGDVAFSTSRVARGTGEITANYDLTEADQAFVQSLKEQIAGLDQENLTVDQILDIGRQLDARIEADLADFRGYMDEEAEIRRVRPMLNDQQLAWVRGEPDALREHQGLRYFDAEKRYQAEFQARVRAYLEAIRSMGGADINIVSDLALDPQYDAVAADALRAAQELVPTSWIEASNEVGDVFVDRLLSRTAGGDFMGDRSGAGVMRILHNREMNPIDLNSTALHEFMHRLEQSIPQLGNLEADFYDMRTSGDVAERLRNGLNQMTKLDDWKDEYLGRIPVSVGRPAYTLPNGTELHSSSSYELLSIGAEVILGGGWTYEPVILREDEQYVSFILGLFAALEG